MNRLWLKIVGCVVVVLLAAIAVYVFWPRPPESSITESPARANQQQTQQNRPRPFDTIFWQSALLHKEPADSAHRDLWLVVACCRQILEEPEISGTPIVSG